MTGTRQTSVLLIAVQREVICEHHDTSRFSHISLIMLPVTSLLAAPASKVDSDTEDCSNKKNERKFMSDWLLTLDETSNNICDISVIRVRR